MKSHCAEMTVHIEKGERKESCGRRRPPSIYETGRENRSAEVEVKGH